MATFGGSIEQLAGNENRIDMQKRAALEAVLARMVEHHNQQELLSQQQAGQQALQATNLGQQQRQFQATQMFDQNRDRRFGNQFDQQLEETRHKDALQGQRQDTQAEWQRKVFEKKDQDQTDKELLDEARHVADRGGFDNAEHVIKLFPSLAKFSSSLADDSLAYRTAWEDQNKWAHGAAGAINAPSRYQNMIDAERADKVNGSGHWYTGDTSENIASARKVFTNPDIQGWQVSKVETQPTADRFSKMLEANPRMSGIVSPNPETGMVEANQRPPWRTSGTFTRTSGAPQGPPAPNTAIPLGAIQRLKANPNMAADFDQMFGPGASRTILGN